MGLFDIFNSKEKKEKKVNDEYMKNLIASVFPGGEDEILKDTKRVHLILQGKLSMDECKACVAASKSLLYISEDKSAERMLPYIIDKTNNKGTEEEVYSIYAYLSGEGAYINQSINQFLGITDLYEDSVNSDELPNGYGEYGLTETNPILTISIPGSNDYLSRLRFNGQPITYERLGSTSSDVTTGKIDIYSTSFSSKRLKNIYICHYHRKNSTKAPKGFTII